MPIEPIERVAKEILNKYNRNPKGWVYLRDKNSILIIGPEESYRLELIPLNPFEHIGVGTKVKITEEAKKISRDTPSFGWRPFSDKAIERILTTAIKNRGLLPKSIVKRILGVKPTPLNKIEGRSIVGPIVYSNFREIIKGQRELDLKLEREAQKLFRKRYPERAIMYG